MTPAASVSRFSIVVGAVLIVAMTIFSYSRATTAGFILDDDDYVINNASLRDAAGLRNIWFDPSATPQYYPLVHTSFWLDYQIWQLWAGGYHWTNLALHIINSLLLWRLLTWLSVRGAWVAAIIFAVHPVNVESVAWISERKNVLSGLFYLSSLLCFLRYWDFTKPDTNDSLVAVPTRPRVWLALCYAFFIAALLSKTVTATLPAILMVLIWWKQGELRFSTIKSLIPMFVMGFLFGVLTIYLEQDQVGDRGIDWGISPIQRVLVAGRAIWFYAAKLTWPTALVFIYPRWPVDATVWWQWTFPIAVISVVITLWVMRGRIGRGPLAAVLIFVGTLFPALGFFDAVPMRFSYVADHFQYLASIALIVLIVAMASELAARWMTDTPIIARFAAALVITTLAGLTWAQTNIYENVETLWRDTVKRNPESFIAQNSLGTILNRQGMYEEAEPHFLRAIEIKPTYVDAVVNLAKAREGQNDVDGASQYYQQAIDIDDTFAPALNGMGAMMGSRGDTESARQFFERAIASSPGYASAHVNLGLIYRDEGRTEDAIREFREAFDLQPDSLPAMESLIQIFMESGRYDEAKSVATSALLRNPEDFNLVGVLGLIAEQAGDDREAIRRYERLQDLMPGDPASLDRLSTIHEKLGDKKLAEKYRRSSEPNRNDAMRTLKAWVSTTRPRLSFARVN